MHDISAQACQDLKSNGVDTVICLDVSDSMAGEPVEKAKEAIGDLLNGKPLLSWDLYVGNIVSCGP